MGRMVRRVPMNWQHPKNARGHYQPMYDETYEEALADFQQRKAAFEANPDAQAEALAEGATTFEEWDGDAPDPAYYRPKWDDDAVLGYCYYEDVSEGTPLSPVFATPDELVNWLVEHEGLRREAAQRFVEIGWSMSMVMSPETGFVRGVEVMDIIAPKKDED